MYCVLQYMLNQTLGVGPMAKAETITMRVSSELKSLAEAAAEADSRSLTNYIEALIRADAARKGIKPQKGSRK